MYHRSVLLKESMEGLAIQPGGTYVDATFGGGGHAAEILNHLTTGRLYAFDQDSEAINQASDDPRCKMIHQNFRYLWNFLRLYNAIPADGILADLGVSSHQIDEATRGFSIRFDGPLDMRMDARKTLTAKKIINEYTEEKLRDVLRNYGELPQANRIASRIVSARKERTIESTHELTHLLIPLAARGREQKFLAKIFQALRIEVNGEMEALKEFLEQCVEVLKTGGRLVVISYHSLEDTLVKHFIRSGNFDGIVEKDFYGNIQAPLKPLTRKVIKASEQEIKENPRARSARLRIAQKAETVKTPYKGVSTAAKQ